MSSSSQFNSNPLDLIYPPYYKTLLMPRSTPQASKLLDEACGGQDLAKTKENMVEVRQSTLNFFTGGFKYFFYGGC